MNRAAVVIAVQSAGNLPKLKAALDGASHMAQWAAAQNFDPVVSITDADEPVTAKKIKDAIKALVKSDSYEQLMVYFAGHGVNLQYSEYWLLSDAPDDTQEAVNVASSVHLAKRCGIPHVILLSDACRTAPEGIRAQAIRGSEIFPNEGRGGPQKAVDVFYASLLGEPALEIQDQASSALRYVSIYTEELLAALRGERDTILTPDAADSTKAYLRPQPLKRHLMSAVPKLVEARLGPLATHTQIPDAEILSDEFAFLQVFDVTGLHRLSGGTRGGPMMGIGGRPAPTLASITTGALKQALREPAGGGNRALAELARSTVAGVQKITQAVTRERASNGAMHFETDCGFKISGATIAHVSASPGVLVEQVTPQLARVYVEQRPATNVLIQLADGRAVVLPAIRDFIAALAVEDGELRNVSYEPSDRSPRWQGYLQQRDELTALRALIATSFHMGTFRLESADLSRLLDKIKKMEGSDPTMALYGAYLCHRLGKPDLIPEVQKFVVDDLHATLFDLDLLTDREPGAAPASQVFPFVPMLAQGWSLLGAFDAWTPQLEELRPHVANSLWTMFDHGALPLLRKELERLP